MKNGAKKILTKFFVLTRGRTGSTAVMDELHKSEAISATQELFLIEKIETETAAFREMFDLILPFIIWKEALNSWKNLPLKFFNDQYLANIYLSQAESRAAKEGSLGFGFKVLSNNLTEWPFLAKLLRKRNYIIVYLTRNIANQVLSGIIANKSGIWNTKSKNFSLEKYSIDLDEFKNRVDGEIFKISEDLSLLESLGFPFIKVEYEEFCKDRSGFYEKIFSFLQVPMHLPPTSDYSIILRNVKDVVLNYSDLQSLAEEMGIPFIE